MNLRLGLSRVHVALSVATVAGAALAGVAAVSGAAQAAAPGPCDVYAAAGTPCVAAHSTTPGVVRGV
jgi:hypothetical protein